MPFKATEAEIKEFFKDFELDKDSIYIDQRNGKRSGKGLVIFKSKEEAQKAKADKNFGKIGESDRYVVLCDKDEDFFRGATDLDIDE